MDSNSIITIILILFYITTTTPSTAKPTISISPSTLSKSTNQIQLNWTGLTSPSNLDWLCIYSPPVSPHENFIDYMFLSQSSPSTWQFGSGTISLPLTNLRSNYSFRIFHWTEADIDPTKQDHDHDHNQIPGTKDLVVESIVEVGFEGMTRVAEQIHLAYIDKGDEMRVMFVCGDSGFVRYYSEEEEEEQDGDVAMVVANVGRYERVHMCDSPADDSIG
ncbi:hypothetical protein ACFE04_023518 [Oxalis oulophora]